MEEERAGRQAAESERAAIAEEAAQKVAAAAAAGQEIAATQASLAARLATAEADLADTHSKLADARSEAEKRLREHWETSRCACMMHRTIPQACTTHCQLASDPPKQPSKQEDFDHDCLGLNFDSLALY